MLKYNITEGTGGRVLVVQADDLQRYAVHDSNDTPLKFTRIGGNAVAIMLGRCKVYKKPSGVVFHNEYLKHNARSLWLGYAPKFDRLARNLYEYMEEI